MGLARGDLAGELARRTANLCNSGIIGFVHRPLSAKTDDSGAIDIDLPMVAAYRRVQAFDSAIDTTIHPDDEMFHTLTQILGNPKDRSIVSYLETGREGLGSIENLLETAGRSLDRVGRVLEFASGYGRLTRHLVNRVPAGQLTVSDIQPAAMEFSSRVFGTRSIVSSSSPNEVDLEGPYGLIIVISLFTHLPPHRYVQWLRHIYDALAPDGILVFTLHDASLLPEAERHASGYTFLLASENDAIESGNLKIGLAEYGSTYVSWPTAQLLAQVCEIGNFYRCPKDGWDVHDLLVASREPIPALESWPRTSLIRGFVDGVEAAGDERVRVWGWVGDVSRSGPVKDLQLQIDGEAWQGEVSLGLPRDDVAQVTERPGWSRSGWRFEGNLAVEPGRHLITVVADGTCFALEWKDLPGKPAQESQGCAPVAVHPDLKAKLAPATDESNALRQQIAALQAQLDAERRVRDGILQSFSWRLTKPGREVMQVVRKLRGFKFGR